MECNVMYVCMYIYIYVVLIYEKHIENWKPSWSLTFIYIHESFMFTWLCTFTSIQLRIRDAATSGLRRRSTEIGMGGFNKKQWWMV
jgi:hypothetical protein